MLLKFCFTLILYKLTSFSVLAAPASFDNINIQQASGDLGIVGGEPIDITQAPYQVSVSVESEGRNLFLCGGTIIAPDFVLTSGICIMVAEFFGGHIFIRAGSNFNYTGGVIANVSKHDIHPKCDLDTGNYDIGLLFLEEKLEYGDTIQPVPLAAIGAELPTGTSVEASGWGETKEGGEAPHDSLRRVSMSMIDQEQCKKSYIGTYIHVTDIMICSGVDGGGKGVCGDDAGGPIMYNGVQYGIISMIHIGCAIAKYPSISTKIAAVREWIDETMHEERNKNMEYYK